MTISENAARARVGTLPHPAPVRASCERSVSDFGTSGGNTSHDLDCGNDCFGPEGHAEGCPVHCGCYPNPRRMIAVTVALSEPWGSPEIDWPETIAANLRLLYANTTVEVIDTWSPSEDAQLGLQRSERVDQ